MYISKLFLLIVVAAVATSACGATRAVLKVPEVILGAKPEVELRCSPRVGIGAPFSAVPFTAELRVKNPGEKYWCPAVEWHVDGTYISGHESDCDPYDAVVTKEGREPEVWSEPMKFFGFRQGDHLITVRLLRAGRVIASKDCGVTAH